MQPLMSCFHDISGYSVKFRDIVCYTDSSTLLKPGQVLLYLALGNKAILDISVDVLKHRLEIFQLLKADQINSQRMIVSIDSIGRIN